MKRFLLIAAFAAAGSLYGQVSIGFHIGSPPAPRIVRVRPVAPGPGYIWVDGYWYTDRDNGRYVWHQGYWTRPPYEGAHWVSPRYEGGQFFSGYWEGPRGRFDHDHRWDRDN